MNLTTVLAVDPGKTTGFAWHRIGDPAPVIVDELDALTFLSWAEEKIAARGPELLLVVESYTITAQTLRYSRQPWPLEVIGTLRYLAHRHGTDLVFQAPATAKNVVPNERLRDLGWYVPGKDHGRDATRHLAVWLRRAGLLEFPASSEERLDGSDE